MRRWCLLPRISQFKLRWIHTPSAAGTSITVLQVGKCNIVVTNSREGHGPVVAEHVMALIFALAKKIPRAARLLQKHRWGQEVIWSEGPRRREIAGSTLGLTGVGSIGRRVAQMASAVGMCVIAVREQVERGRPEGVQAVFAPSALDEMLKQCDFVVLAASLLAATHGLINADRLAVMKPGACLIHVGRGAQVDEAALVEALRTRRIAGAALDVFEREPLPPESPHTAGLSDKLWHRH